MAKLHVKPHGLEGRLLEARLYDGRVLCHALCHHAHGGLHVEDAVLQLHGSALLQHGQQGGGGALARQQVKGVLPQGLGI